MKLKLAILAEVVFTIAVVSKHLALDFTFTQVPKAKVCRECDLRALRSPKNLL